MAPLDGTIVARAPDEDVLDREAVPIGALEQLPKWLIVIPILMQWLLLSLRYGSPTLPCSANPRITAGGLAGEGKVEYFRAMGAVARAATAAYACIENRGSGRLDAALAAMSAAGLNFPIIAKPDVGWCGFGVRLVRSPTELQAYLTAFPADEQVILQRFVTYDGEAGIYYMRAPGAARGQIVGLVLRSSPQVIGDGVHTVAQLIAADPRLRRLGRDNFSEPCCDVDLIPTRGEAVRIAIVASTRVGGLYRDAGALVTPALCDAVEAIARDMPEFHVGRFDVRYESLPALRAGRGFSIVEVNGVGSEAVQAWEPTLSVRQAFAIVFEKQRQIFTIGNAMRSAGWKPIGIAALGRLYLRQQRLIRRYPPSN